MRDSPGRFAADAICCDILGVFDRSSVCEVNILAAVVHQDGCLGSHDIVRVGGGDGEVVHALQAGPGLDVGDDLGGSAVVVEEVVAGAEVGGVGPFALVGVPEGVLVGGVDDAAVVDAVVQDVAAGAGPVLVESGSPSAWRRRVASPSAVGDRTGVDPRRPDQDPNER